MITVHNNDIAPLTWLDLWGKHENVEYVLRMFSEKKLLDWFALYKIYETIRDDPRHKEENTEGKANIIRWTSEDENESFFQTANWYRHSDFGKNKGRPNAKPSKEMSLGEGNHFIRGLIYHWLEWKQNE